MAVPAQFRSRIETVLIRYLVHAVFIFVASVAVAEASVWQICERYEQRVTCVVDGDTLWYRGEKMRLVGIDAPEVQGRCRKETDLAAQATAYLTTLLSSGAVQFTRHGHDRYGRTLVRIWTASDEVGPAIVQAGLAVPYGTRPRHDWCH